VQNQSAIANAGAAELYGLEVEYEAVPIALPGISFDGTASWVHSAYTKGNPFDPDGLFLDPSQRARLDIRGNELIRSPKFRFSLGAQYEIDMADIGLLTLRGEAGWTDTIYNDIFNGQAPFQSATTQPAYWLLNARLIWASEDRRTQIQLFGENLTNQLYANNRIAFNTPQTLVSVSGQFAAPRTFGVRATLKL
jgi:iron complex outermembrane recepter protein